MQNIPVPTSTNMNQQFLRSNFVPTVEVTINNAPVQVLDVLNPEYIRLLENLVPASVVNYDGRPITTVSFNSYGNTSAWWFIVATSGYTHPLQIPKGYALPIPDAISAISMSKLPTTNANVNTVVI